MTTTNDIIAIMQKAARCWSGYEPVPGAKAYSEGSCRPKGSKKTQKEVKNPKKEKKAEMPKPAQPFKLPDTVVRAYKARTGMANDAMKKLMPANQHPPAKERGGLK
jgi:hypothetical protein